MKKTLFLLALWPLVAWSQAVESPQQLQVELQDAQAQFQRALKLFNPWYTGPLITPSATMMPPGVVNFQPYLNVQTNYAQFNEDRHSVSTPNLVQLQSQNIFQTGITNWMDTLFIFQGQESWLQNKNGGGYGDTQVGLGFQILKQDLYIPKIKLSIKETFPTGRYKNLSPTDLGLDGVGAGAYSTQFCLAFGKLLFWDTQHPVNTRLFFGYTVATTVHVADFNVYGGGFGTAGKVRPGNVFSTDLGIEWSVNQPWVLALDIVYTCQDSTRFHGKPGVTATGHPAEVGSRSSDNLSLAPAFEYNWNSNLGIVCGAWFSVYGKNSANFATGLFSVCWTFQPTTKF
jgi:hypothetical protein